MAFEPHGDYRFSRKGEIFIIEFFHLWNKEGVLSYFRDYKKLIAESGLSRFGVLSDLTHFQGATPDAIEYFPQISRWAASKGQMARALVARSTLAEFIIQKIDQGQTLFPVKFFHDGEAALVWLESFGLSSSTQVG